MTRTSSLAALALAFVACNDSAEVLTPDTGTPEAAADVQASDVTTQPDSSDATTTDATTDARDEEAADASVDAPACEAGLEVCNGVCTDPSTYLTDPKNCGFCSHDCQGNTCANGLCATDTIGSGLPNPSYLAVNSTTVYLTTSGAVQTATSGAVYQCPVTGCPTKLGPMTSGLDNPNGIAVDSSKVYWDNSGDLTTTSGSVMSCPLSDCGKNNSTRVTIAKSLTFTQGIALDSSNVYFGTWGAKPYFGNATISSCPLAGCTGSPTAVMTGQSKPIFVALDGSSLFMAPMGGSTSIPYVETGPIPGPSVGTRIYSGTVQDQIVGFALYNSNFYVNDGFKGEIDMCSETTCINPIPLVLNLSTSWSLDVDSKGIYFSDINGIETCPLVGCITPTLLATTTNMTPTDVRVNGNYVYWVEQDGTGSNGQVMRVAR
jgi:hypothetical protein